MSRAVMQQALDAQVIALQDLEQEICRHENTHRGGAIWEICDDCGVRWADDRGGKPRYSKPKVFSMLEKSIKALREELAKHEMAPMGWKDLTSVGQIKLDDVVHFWIGPDRFIATAKSILNQGTDKEEIVYDKKKNHYFITSMVLEGESSHKHVRFLSASPT